MSTGGGGSALATAYLAVRAEQGQLARDLSGIRSIFSTAVNGMARTAKSAFSAVAGFLSNTASTAAGMLIAGGVRSITSALSELGSQLISTNAKMENYTISMGVMLKSKEKAATMMHDIEAMASKTPFSTDNLTQAVVMMKNYGFEAEEILPKLRIIGDAAAASPQGMAEGIKHIAFALGQMRAAGKVMGGDVNQLTSAGIPVWEILAQKTGKSIADVRKMTQAGTLDSAQAIEMLMQGMAERTGGMMEQQSHTWTGLVSTLKDNSAIALCEIGKPLFEMAKLRLENLVSWMDTGKAKEMTVSLKAMMASMVQFGSEKLDQGMAWLQSDRAAEMASSVKETAIWMRDIAAISWDRAKEFFNSETAKRMLDVVKDLAAKVKELASGAGESIAGWFNSGAAKEMAASVGEVATKLFDMAKAFGPLLAGIMIMDKLGTVVNGVIPVITNLGAALIGLSVNPIGALVTALGLLAAAFIASKIAGMEFGEYIAHMAGTVIPGLENAVNRYNKTKSDDKSANKHNQKAEESLAAGDTERAQREINQLKEETAALEEQQRVHDLKRDKARDTHANAKLGAAGKWMGDFGNMSDEEAQAEFSRRRRAGFDKQFPEDESDKSRRLQIEQNRKTIRDRENDIRNTQAKNAIAETIKSRGRNLVSDSTAAAAKSAVGAGGSAAGRLMAAGRGLADQLTGGFKDALKNKHEKEVAKEIKEFEERTGMNTEDFGKANKRPKAQRGGRPGGEMDALIKNQRDLLGDPAKSEARRKANANKTRLGRAQSRAASRRQRLGGATTDARLKAQQRKLRLGIRTKPGATTRNADQAQKISKARRKSGVQFHGLADFSKSIQTSLGKDDHAKKMIKGLGDIKETLDKVDGTLEKPKKLDIKGDVGTMIA